MSGSKLSGLIIKRRIRSMALQRTGLKSTSAACAALKSASTITLRARISSATLKVILAGRQSLGIEPGTSEPDCSAGIVARQDRGFHRLLAAARRYLGGNTNNQIRPKKPKHPVPKHAWRRILAGSSIGSILRKPAIESVTIAQAVILRLVKVFAAGSRSLLMKSSDCRPRDGI